MRFASRLSEISASPTMAVMEEAQRLRKEGIDVIDLGPGEPDSPTPESIKQAGIDAIINNITKYTAAAGLVELRKAVAEKFNREWDTDFSDANVAITCGAKHAIYNVCMAVFERADEVLIPAPHWVTFPEVVKMAGAAPLQLLTRPEDDFVLKVEDVDCLRSSCTRGMIINSPNNPTGAVLPESTVRELARWCRQCQVFLLADETYEYFVYDGHKHVSLAATVEPSDDHYAIVSSMSKTYSMTGWRIGYVLGSPDLIKKIAAFQSHQTGNPASMSQMAALAALQNNIPLVSSLRKEYEKRRRVLLEALEQIPGFSCPRPNGAFYAFPNITRVLEATGIPNSEEFARFLIQEARVATVPGSAFGMEGFIRISYATSPENLEKGLARIRKAVEQAMARLQR